MLVTEAVELVKNLALEFGRRMDEATVGEWAKRLIPFAKATGGRAIERVKARGEDESGRPRRFMPTLYEILAECKRGQDEPDEGGDSPDLVLARMIFHELGFDVVKGLTDDQIIQKFKLEFDRIYPPSLGRAIRNSGALMLLQDLIDRERNNVAKQYALEVPH